MPLYMLQTAPVDPKTRIRTAKWQNMLNKPVEQQEALKLMKQERDLDLKPPRGYYTYRIKPVKAKVKQ